jgi:hypothetical protein
MLVQKGLVKIVVFQSALIFCKLLNIIYGKHLTLVIAVSHYSTKRPIFCGQKITQELSHGYNEIIF